MSLCVCDNSPNVGNVISDNLPGINAYLYDRKKSYLLRSQLLWKWRGLYGHASPWGSIHRLHTSCSRCSCSCCRCHSNSHSHSNCCCHTREAEPGDELWPGRGNACFIVLDTPPVSSCHLGTCLSCPKVGYNSMIHCLCYLILPHLSFAIFLPFCLCLCVLCGCLYPKFCRPTSSKVTLRQHIGSALHVNFFNFLINSILVEIVK